MWPESSYVNTVNMAKKTYYTARDIEFFLGNYILAHILRLKCTEFAFSCMGLGPRPRWESLQRSPEAQTLYLYLRGLLLMEGGEGNKRGRKGQVKGREGGGGRDLVILVHPKTWVWRPLWLDPNLPAKYSCCG